MWQGVLQSLVPILGGGLTLYLYHRQNESSDETHWIRPIGGNGVWMAGVFVVMFWLLPAGALLSLPLLLVVSVLSPAARIDWREHRTPRLMALGVAVLCLGAAGLVPVSEPIEPEAWGRPLFTDNPDAPFYPASQQYTWVTNDAVVLQSISMRLPYQAGIMKAESVALTIASLFNMETDRMHQAIELIDEEVPFVRLNPEEIVLVSAPAPSSLDLILDSEGAGETVEFRLYDIQTTAFGLNADGAKVGEVAIVAKASWGGQLDLLVMVSPLAGPGTDYDPFGEQWIRDWLNAR